MATKRSLFKKPAWAAQSKPTAEDGKSIFQQNVYEDILRENQRKEERRLAKQRQKDEQKASGRRSKAQDDEQPNKKRRVSAETYTIDSDDDVNDDERKFVDGYESQSDSDTADKVTQIKTRNKRSGRRSAPSRETTPLLMESPRKNKKADKSLSEHPSRSLNRNTQPESEDELIVVEEISAKPSPRKSKTIDKKAAVSESESDSDSDEYVRELKRAARAEARSKKLLAASDQEARGQSVRSPSAAAPGSTHTLDSQRNSPTPTPATAGPSDPEVLIRIKTIIPGCNEVFVKRKASQTLEGLEKYFVETHKLSDQLRQKLFFTWNLQKLYKSTTMSSILAQIRAKYGPNIDGSDRSEGRIELEAMTVEILNLRKQQLDRERKIANGEWQEEGGADQGTDDLAQPIEPPEAVQPRKGIVINLKSNNEDHLPSMALRVHPDTAVSRIIRGYKSKMKVDSSMRVYLMFDGDRLEGHQMVEEIGFEDQDCVDIAAD